MKKRLLVCMLIGAMLLGTAAYAEERNPASEAASNPEGVQARLEHLESHGKRATFFCNGRLVKLRIAPGANKMNGCTAEGEEFEILDTFGEWVHVEITKSNADNDQSRKGMTGWIHVDHIDCACDLEKTESFPETEE